MRPPGRSVASDRHAKKGVLGSSRTRTVGATRCAGRSGMPSSPESRQRRPLICTESGTTPRCQSSDTARRGSSAAPAISSTVPSGSSTSRLQGPPLGSRPRAAASTTARARRAGAFVSWMARTRSGRAFPGAISRVSRRKSGPARSSDAAPSARTTATPALPSRASRAGSASRRRLP
jgi:hypothetical protein